MIVVSRRPYFVHSVLGSAGWRLIAVSRFGPGQTRPIYLASSAIVYLQLGRGANGDKEGSAKNQDNK